MHVICTVDNFSFGGLQRHMFALAHALMSRGHQYEFLLIGSGKMANVVKASGISLTVLHTGPNIVQDITEFLRDKQADVLLNTCVSEVRRALRDFDFPTMSVIEFCWGEDGPQMYNWSRLTGAVFCNSASADRFKRLFPGLCDRVFTVNNPVTISGSGNGEQPPTWRSKHGLDNSVFVIGSLGRYTFVKRHLRTIYDATVFLRAVPDAMLVICGSRGQEDGADWPSSYDACIELVDSLELNGRVLLLDYESDPEDMLNSIDVYVNMSESEGQSIAISEALYCGKPVITTAVGGTDEQIPLGDCTTGFLLPVYGHSGLSTYLHSLHEDISLRERLSANAISLAREKFSLGQYVEQVEIIMAYLQQRGLSENPVLRPRYDNQQLLIVTYGDISRVSPRLRAFYMKRCLAPFGVNVEVRNVHSVGISDIEGSDIVVFHRVAHALLGAAEHSVERSRLLKKINFLWEYSLRCKVTGYDLDDFMFVPESEPMGIADLNLHFLRTASFVIANSQAAAKRFKKYASNVWVIENPVDERLWNPRISTIRPPSNSITVGWVAGRTHDQDAAHAWEIFAGIAEAVTHAQLLVLGDPTTKPPVCLQDKVTIIPTVPWYTVPQIVAQFGVNLAPLVHNEENACKGHGHICEPALFRIPSVVQCTESYLEFVEDGINGLICDEPSSWSAAVSRLCNDNHLRERIGSQARNATLLRFGFPTIGYNYRMLLDRLAPL